MADLQQASAGPDGPAETGTWDGAELKRAWLAASHWLDRHTASLNALNVFPVPDGDTGTNMTLTLRAACQQVANSPSGSAAEISAGLSYGALMGARGNSGVILSQVLRGFHHGLHEAGQLDANGWVTGLRDAAATAYQAVLKPVEGTMLTVIREMAEGAEAAHADGAGLVELMAATVAAGRASVARTPSLLQKLRDAGVVDAGGQGLCVIFEGLLRHARGEAVAGAEFAAPGAADLAPGAVHVAHGEYGYCTNFILAGRNLDFPTVRDWIAGQGDSVVVVGDDRLIKVHVHTARPGEILNYVGALGSLRQVAITDMQEQHEEFLDRHAQDAPPPAAGDEGAPTVRVATLAVVAGAGMTEAFRSMGATALVEGGQTMNPSTQELLQAVESLPQQEVIILPNNGNILLAARQVAALTQKQVRVVPSDTLPQGMAALIAFNYDANLDANARAMEAAAHRVETGEITTAVRDADIDGLAVKVGDVIGLHNGTLVLAGASHEDVARRLLDVMQAGEHELGTIYYGQDVAAAEAATLAAAIQESYPHLAVELLAGGQPFYAYIISVE